MKPCEICSHSQRDVIDQALRNRNEPVGDLARVYGLGVRELRRHVKHHLGVSQSQHTSTLAVVVDAEAASNATNRGAE